MTFDLVDTVADPLDRRISTPEAESLSPADQAVIDAEFVAMMLVEFPAEEPSTGSTTPRTPMVKASRRPPRPPQPGVDEASGAIPRATSRGVRRPTDPRTRSPPR